jgi:hypothetical protein
VIATDGASGGSSSSAYLSVGWSQRLSWCATGFGCHANRRCSPAHRNDRCPDRASEGADQRSREPHGRRADAVVDHRRLPACQCRLRREWSYAEPNRPTVRLTSTTFPMRAEAGQASTGRVRIPVHANQIAATKVKLAQVRGKRVGGTAGGSYTCTEPTKHTVSVALDAFGVKLVRRHHRLAVKVTFRLINGSGVTHTALGRASSGLSRRRSL